MTTSFVPVANQVQAPSQMTIGDMLNMARSAQAYQQSQQLNPLQLQKAQLDIQQAKQLNPLAVKKAEQEVKQSEIATQQKQLEFDQSHHILGSNLIAGLEARAKVLASEPNGTKQMLAELNDAEKLMNTSGVPTKENGPMALAKEKLKNNDVQGYLAFLQNTRENLAGSAERYQANLPQPITNATGQVIGYTRAGNKIQEPGGNVAPTATPQENPANSAANINNKTSPNFNLGANPSNIQVQATGDVVKKAIADYTDSITNMAGQIQNQEMVDKKLLSFLKDPNTKTGPIADFLAGKTKQASLSEQEQEVVKLLQQRIQGLNPRTDADAESKRQAFGSFKIGKDALADLVRQDLGALSNERLLHTGTINSAGNSQSPNLPAVSKFRNNYSQLISEPASPYVMQYMGIVGRGKNAQVDSHDEQALLKLKKLSGLSLKELEAKRQQYLNFTGAGEQ